MRWCLRRMATLVVGAMLNPVKEQTTRGSVHIEFVSYKCYWVTVQLATLLKREYGFYSWQWQNHSMFYKGSWHVFVIPPLLSSSSSSLIYCLPLSVLPYQSVPRYISLHLSRSSSSNLSRSHFCLYLPIFLNLFQLFLIKSHFTLLARWANIMWQTVSQMRAWHTNVPAQEQYIWTTFVN